MLATIIIPYADYHKDVVQEAEASARAQTVPVEVLVRRDRAGHGPGFVRNSAAQDAKAPFLVFLDADDTLKPDFVERCVKAYQPGSYVYTDWEEWNGVHTPKDSCHPYADGSYHIVTTLYPTRAFRFLGGFDTTLLGGEDTDFYLRSGRFGVCPVHVPDMLVTYRPLGKRGAEFEQSESMQQVMEDIYYRNGGQKAIMGCNCGQTIVADPQAGYMPGMVQATALYAAMNQLGPATGYTYPRNHMGVGETMWVYPADVQARPDLWALVPTPQDVTPTLDEIMRMAGVE